MDEQVKEQTSDSPLQEQAKDSISECDKLQDKAERGFFGKFSTKEQLVEAYNSLEAEFTRRSQKLKELEQASAQKSEQEKWAKKVDELTQKYPVAKELTAEIGEYIAQKKELIEDESCLEKALLAVLSARHSAQNKPIEATPIASLRQRAESSYKQSEEILLVPNILPSGGELPTMPKFRPQSVKEAGDMARKILNDR